MHLSEEQLIAVLCGVADDVCLRHTRDCAECGGTVELFRQQLDEARTDHVKAAAREDHFWLRQQAAIRRRTALSRPPIPLPRWTLAVAALIVLAAALVIAGPSAPAGAQTQQSDPDYQLLVAVEQNLARPVPVAVEPAAVLSADLNAAWQNAMAEHMSQQDTAQR